MKKTIYRKCACGETAHDLKAERLECGWAFSWTCRNCFKPALNRNGVTKLVIRMDNGQNGST